MLTAAYVYINLVRAGKVLSNFTDMFHLLDVWLKCITESENKITPGSEFRWYHSITRNQIKNEILPIYWNMQFIVIGFHVICFLHALADVCPIDTNAVWTSGHG